MEECNFKLLVFSENKNSDGIKTRWFAFSFYQKVFELVAYIFLYFL